MTFGKVVKTSSYYSRKKVPFRRRRECKTNYHKRQIMVRQNLKKPNLQQTRLVVRISNKFVTAQLVKAYPNGDKTFAQAHSKELASYNITMGLKNYSACYMTGLLLGKRAMRQNHLHKIYRGNQENVGVTHLVTNLSGQPASISAILDIGLRHPTTGNRTFAVLKGVADAGVNIPYSPRRLFGYDDKQKKLDSTKLANRIHGVDLAKHIVKTKDSNHQHSSYSNSATGFTAEMYPSLVQQAIKAIHKNPRVQSKPNVQSKKPYNKVAKMKKKTKTERDSEISQQKQAWMAELGMQQMEACAAK